MNLLLSDMLILGTIALMLQKKMKFCYPFCLQKIRQIKKTCARFYHGGIKTRQHILKAKLPLPHKAGKQPKKDLLEKFIGLVYIGIG